MRRFWIRALGALLLLGACSEENPSGTGNLCRTGTFQLDPNGGAAYTLTQDYRFLCQDAVFEPDIQFLYDDCPAESDGFFWFYSGGSNSTFQASLGDYVFTGSVLRELAGGVGPFAAGTYEKKSGSTTLEAGQFSFHEGDMQPPGPEQCSPRSVSGSAPFLGR